MSDYLGYEGKLCVVTGAASGMGAACAKQLVELGAKLIGLDVQQIDLPVRKPREEPLRTFDIVLILVGTRR